jgi:hypothetical protein
VTHEEAVEIVLAGVAYSSEDCRTCGGTGYSFKGGLPVGDVRVGDRMATRLCYKCNGRGKHVKPEYEEARAMLGLPSFRGPL